MGKKYIAEGRKNSESLVELVKLIKENGENSYLYELLNDIDIRRVLGVLSNKYKYSSGWFIAEDVIYGICQTELMLLVWYEMNVNLMPRDEELDDNGKVVKDAEEVFHDAILCFISKRLPGRVWRQIQKERPSRNEPKKKNLITRKQQNINEFNEYYQQNDIEQNGVWSEYWREPKHDKDYKYYEILSGDFTELAQICDELQTKNTYGNGIDKLEEDESFSELIENCTPNQQNILRMKFQENYTEREIAEELGISQQSVNRAIDRAKENIKKKFLDLENFEDYRVLNN